MDLNCICFISLTWNLIIAFYGRNIILSQANLSKLKWAFSGVSLSANKLPRTKQRLRGLYCRK